MDSAALAGLGCGLGCGTTVAISLVVRNLDVVLRELEHEDEPNVLVEPEIGAFCLVQPRDTTPRERPSGRIPLDAILMYLAKPF